MLETAVMDSLTECLNALHPSYPSSILKAVEPILLTNLEKKRFDPEGDQSLNAYVRRVVDTYISEQPKVEAILHQRDPQAWQAFYRNQLRRWVYAALKKHRQVDILNYNRQSIDTITQEAAAVIFEKHYHYEVPFIAWAKTVVVNCMYNEIRLNTKSRKQREFDPEGGQAQLAGSVEKLLEKAESNRELQQILNLGVASLPPSQKEVIEKHFFEAVPLQELAHDLEITSNAVYQRKIQGLKKLKSFLETYGTK